MKEQYKLLVILHLALIIRLNSNRVCGGGILQQVYSIYDTCKHYPIRLALYTNMDGFVYIFQTHDHNSICYQLLNVHTVERKFLAGAHFHGNASVLFRRNFHSFIFAERKRDVLTTPLPVDGQAPYARVPKK